MNNYWYKEWMQAKKENNIKYTDICKQKHKQIVIDKLKEEPSFYRVESLAMFPSIYLN